MKPSHIHRWRRFPQRGFEMSRAVYTPVVREHPSKPQGRVGSPQWTPDSGDAVADFPQTQNLTPSREDAKGEVVATAVFCRFGISPRIQENERESKKTRCKGIRSIQFSAFRFQNLCTLRNLRMIFLCSIRGDSRHSRAANLCCPLG
jgi:hypothetical protein